MTATLTPKEIDDVTGYKRPADQLAELQRQGFYRARRSPTTGQIILERAHYAAVCAGGVQPKAPRVRAPALRSMGAA